MKKITSAVLALVIALCAVSVCGLAADATSVYVTMADKNGDIVVCRQAVSVTDIDNDSAITINDALCCAHEQFYDGGAVAGYGTETGDYGLYITKLWGATNGSGFGYYVNNVSAWSLTDAVKQGDSIYAFIYTDTENFSDTYSFFGSETADVTAYEPFEITLSCQGYDSSWSPVTNPVVGASIVVDGKVTKAVTDENGKATVTLTKAGTHIISAVGKGTIIVPPVCVASVAKQASIITAVTYYFNALVSFISGIFGIATK